MGFTFKAPIVQKPLRASPSGNASASPPASPVPLTNSRHGSSLLLLYLCLVCLVGCMRLLTCTCRHDLPAQERDIIEPSSRNGIPVGLKRSCLPHVNFLHAHAKRGVVAGQEARRTPNVLLCWSETLINDTSQRGTRILHIDSRDGLSGGRFTATEAERRVEAGARERARRSAAGRS